MKIHYLNHYFGHYELGLLKPLNMKGRKTYSLGPMAWIIHHIKRIQN
jgi:hypothetical protein